MKSKTADYPASLSVPLDRTARRVVSKGTHYTPPKLDNQREFWNAPPPSVLPVPEAVRELFEQRKGNLVVEGYLGSSSSGSARLLVRCDCGKYEIRLSNRWRKHISENNRCQFCDQLQKLKLAHLSDEEKESDIKRIEKLQSK